MKHEGMSINSSDLVMDIHVRTLRGNRPKRLYEWQSTIAPFALCSNMNDTGYARCIHEMNIILNDRAYTVGDIGQGKINEATSDEHAWAAEMR